MKILVRAPNWVGDTILAYPFFHALRQAFPQARIGSVCADRVQDLQFRDLVDEVHALPAACGPWARLSTLERTARSLKRSGPWDLGLSLPNSISSAWLLYRTGAKRRRGYRAEGRGLLLNEGISWDPSPERHRAQVYLDLLPAEARPSQPATEFWSSHAFDPSRAWPDVTALEPPPEPYWVVAPGSHASSRRWPSDHFAALAKRVAAETGWRGVVVGSPAESPLARELCAQAPGLEDWTGKGPVGSLWKLLRGSKLTVSNDSGLAHMASVCGSRVQVVWGGGDPRRTRPLGPAAVRITSNPVECWPCERNICPLPSPRTLQCLRGISPDRIWASIVQNPSGGHLELKLPQ